MTYGLTDTGFTIKRLSDIKEEMEQALRTGLGNNINLLSESVLGQIVGIASEREASVWELNEDIYYSQYPDSASGVSLDRVCALSAIIRLQARKSLIYGQYLFGTVGTVVPAGSQIAVLNSAASIFETLAAVTLVAGADAVQSLIYSNPPTAGTYKLQYGNNETVFINWNDNAVTIQAKLNAVLYLEEITVSGAGPFSITFAGTAGKQPQQLLVVASNTLTYGGGAVTIAIAETTVGVSQGTASLSCLVTGPVVANARSLSVINTPVSGLTRTFNPADAVTGRNIESDPELRIRRQQIIQLSEAGPVEAILAALLKLNQDTTKTALENVIVFENIELTTDFRGMPGKSVQAIVYQAGGTTTRDQEIVDTLWASKAGGIETYGNVSMTAVDKMGFNHTIKFSRPVEVPIYLILDLTVNSLYPTDGDDQVKTLMAAWGNALGVGVSIIVYPTLIAQLTAIPGIIDVGVKIGKAPAPTLDNNIYIDDGTSGFVELSRWSTANITVNS